MRRKVFREDRLKEIEIHIDNCMYKIEENIEQLESLIYDKLGYNVKMNVNLVDNNKYGIYASLYSDDILTGNKNKILDDMFNEVSLCFDMGCMLEWKSQPGGLEIKNIIWDEPVFKCIGKDDIEYELPLNFSDFKFLTFDIETKKWTLQ